MSDWQQIWSGDRAKRLWAVPDPQLVALADRWRDSGHQRVLDLGCGPGRHVLLMASRGLEVHASDHSPTAIETCREWLAAAGLEANVWCSEPEEVPQEDGSFDAAIAFNSIYHGTEERVRGAIELIHRKLRPGGECFLSLLSRENRMYGRGEAIGPHTFKVSGMFHQLFAHGGERGIPHHFSSREEVEQLLARFEIETLQHEELRMPSARHTASEQDWFKIPKAWFWRIVARRP